jgi:enamine deaminase RidA (YjgF/YER057c/UK114 family)
MDYHHDQQPRWNAPMSRDVILPEADRRAYQSFHFAPAVRAGELVLCSGQIGLGADGSVPADPTEEFRNAWRAIGRILVEAGLTYAHIQEYTTYHVGLNQHLRAFMTVRDEFLEEPWPAWTAIGVSELAVQGARVEIKVSAIQPQ